MREAPACNPAGSDAAWMSHAVELAAHCAQFGDVPVGACVVAPDGALIGEGWNVREAEADPAGHAEIVAMRHAATSLGRWRLAGCTLFVTLEPCAMCAGALVQSRIERVVFGAWDVKAGACGSVWDLARDPLALHRVEVVGGVDEQRCSALLLDFFATRR
ncbi:tRNA adenosine(34) deaminase TadA [Gephyromycinifex aptenodytis]|uniref:tRNA adenosine(34) deaminase TadA n=1 Tax=Gephyromycinifex aptenodytis TaxID=2716227 RepID=UPI0021F87D1D|nr:tRNA adenosine(34) deaminase TadA [Gephyromycinifex aptenodytis]